jgi:hypothetical protein
MVLLAAISIALSVPPVSATDEKTRVLVRFPEQASEIKTWMKENGWETQRGNPSRFRVGGGQLLMVSQKDSVAVGLRGGFPIKTADWSRLRFRFRVSKLPRGTDLTKKAADDAAFRLFIAFDRDKGLLRPPHTIAYAWTENVEAGKVIKSEHFKNLRYISLGKGLPADPNQWITVERDLVADYRRVFPEADSSVPDLSGLLLKCDSNHTGTDAQSSVAFVELVEPAR